MISLPLVPPESPALAPRHPEPTCHQKGQGKCAESVRIAAEHGPAVAVPRDGRGIAVQGVRLAITVASGRSHGTQ